MTGQEIARRPKPEDLVLPDERDVDAYLQALDWRRAIIERVSGWEELEALEQIHEAKQDMLREKIAGLQPTSPTWLRKELEGKLLREEAATRKCRRLIDQYEREARAWNLKLESLRGADG